MSAWRLPGTLPLWGAFAAALAALAGSLYFSEIRHFVPCTLCWYQRILMYPLVPLLGFALVMRLPVLAYPVLLFSVVGQGVSIYHYLLQKTSWFTSATVCGSGVSCSIMYIDWYGVVTIPLLAMVGFMLISLCIVAYLTSLEDAEAVSLTLHARSALVLAAILGAALAVWLFARMPAPVEPVPPAAATESSDSSTPVAADTGDAGERLFAEHCAACHGAQGQGIPTLTPALQTSERVRTLSNSALQALVRNGITADDPQNQTGNSMPPMAETSLDDVELQAIIAHLRTLVQE